MIEPELKPASHAGRRSGDTAMRTSEIRYRRLFESARDGILILDAATLEITDANPFMTELLGYSRDEFVGRALWEIGLFKDKDASLQAALELQSNGYLRYEDLPLQTKDGNLREVEFVSNVYEEDSHQVIQCNIRDITDRKRAEEERRLLLETATTARAEADAANEIKDQFLATLSHELRTPLTSILGWSQLLNNGELDDATAKRALENVVRNARAQRHLIDDLLDVARITTGKLRLEVHAVKLAELIESVVDGVRPAADARGIRIDAVLDSVVRPISGDPDRLRQIFWNLLTNAIKFTPKGGAVQARLERIASHIEIIITDTGQGIDPELLPHIFNRFGTSNSSDSRRNGGLGLGLSIVRQLVELHGGSVTAQSPGEGLGSTFRVVLPVRSVYPESDGPNKQVMILRNIRTNEQLALHGLRLLVVDDELDARELVDAVLTAKGAAVVSVGSAVEALEEIERQPFDVLISDLGMPVMDGYDLISKIRQLPQECGGRIPAAALTAYAGIEDFERAILAGYQIHVPKPVEPDELTAVVATLAGRVNTGSINTSE